MIPDLIYDVGMNNGDDTAYYLSRGFRVIAIEANPILAEECAKRFSTEVASGRLKILNVGVSDREGEFPFWICETVSEWSSFNREIASRDGCPHHDLTLPCRRFSSILAEHGIPFYLKIDIEGNDMLCLHELQKGSLPKYLSLEAATADPIEHLVSLGYTHFKSISQRVFLPLEMPPSTEQVRFEQTLEQLYTPNILMRIRRALGRKARLLHDLDRVRFPVAWKFPVGSSGPFGEDLRGRWQNADEMRETYRIFQERCGQRTPSIFWDEKEYSFWFDLHARRAD